MRKTVFILLLAVVLGTPLSAQNIALNERIPKIKTANWLDGIVPQQGEYTYIEFVRSNTVPCIESFLKIKRYIADNDTPIQVIFVTREDPSHIDSHLRECLGGRIGALIDDTGRIFQDFGVRYVPFGVIVNRKRKAVWFGNPITVDDDFFKKLTAE